MKIWINSFTGARYGFVDGKYFIHRVLNIAKYSVFYILYLFIHVLYCYLLFLH